MTRKRNLNPNSYYHVTMRGNNRQPIFGTHQDIYELIRAFHHTHSKYPFEILAYCIMTNHYHILIKSDKDSLSKVMASINKRYSNSYAKRYNHVGRIYQQRYFAKEVDSPLGLLTVSKYIHRNPIETKQPMVERLEWYPYSSYPLYFEENKAAPPFLNRDILKNLLPTQYDKSNAGYCSYCLTVPCVKNNSTVF
ncbi:REP-associated tyrosine transposase [Psychrobacillus lasiicapitis]|uniref:Transposase n=1 Tax=Psychrobacillus lasiicapitis TaxID=1636719 RepID=A0A544TBP1_9BACI|nr:transposase [Psychrobacillus lasiicapitis]TQR14874.1 transposase [Psychrobacillus lasiicapitis]